MTLLKVFRGLTHFMIIFILLEALMITGIGVLKHTYATGNIPNTGVVWENHGVQIEACWQATCESVPSISLT